MCEPPNTKISPRNTLKRDHIALTKRLSYIRLSMCSQSVQIYIKRFSLSWGKPHLFLDCRFPFPISSHNSQMLQFFIHQIELTSKLFQLPFISLNSCQLGRFSFHQSFIMLHCGIEYAIFIKYAAEYRINKSIVSLLQ